MDYQHEKKESSGFTILELIIITAIIGILCAMALPNYHRGHPRAPRKSCYSNIRVLQGAIEMYNMDNKNNLITTKLDLRTLKNGKLIKRIEDFTSPNTPEESCKYDITGDITKGGQVYCNYHGTVDNSIPGIADN